MEIDYKGYTIEREVDPWPLKYKGNYKFYNDEHIHHAFCLSEAKEKIDERILTNPNKYGTIHS